MDAPPTTIRVGGASYDIGPDCRVWLLIQEQLRDPYSAPGTPEDAAHNLA